jgi:hypothetical protein
MQRFRRFIGRRVDFNRIKNNQDLTSAEVTSRYLPDELEEFDEMEFGAGVWEGHDVVFTLVVEHGRLARISLGYIPEGAPEDDMMAFSEIQLSEVLAIKGKVLESFFESILPQ